MNRFLFLILTLLMGSTTSACTRRDDWPMSFPADEGLDATILTQMDAYVKAQLPHMRSLLLARHGRMVFEGYYGDASREQLHNIQSMTKSFSSALVGIALKKGQITSLDNKVLTIFQNTGIPFWTRE